MAAHAGQAGRSLILLGVLAAVALCQPSVLTPGRAVERQIAAGEVQSHSFDLQAGQFVRLRFEQLSPFELKMKWLDPDGRAKGEITGSVPVPLSAVTAVAGRYSIE